MDLGQYYQTKSVKLNDSYIVSIHNLKQRHWDNSKAAIDEGWDVNGDLGAIFGQPAEKLVEFYSCIAVDLPAYKYKVESHQTGNLYEKIIMPDYEAKPTFTLTFAETDDFQIDQLLNFIIRRNVHNAGITGMEYIDNGWVDVIAIDILNNNLNKRMLRYQFGFCRLIDYEIYDLSYANNDLPTYRMTFAFESFKKIYEPDIATDDYDPNAIFSDTRNKIAAYQDEYNTRNDAAESDAKKKAKADEEATKKADADRAAAAKKKADKKKSGGSGKPKAATQQAATPQEEFEDAKKALAEAQAAQKQAEAADKKAAADVAAAFPASDPGSFAKSIGSKEVKAANEAVANLTAANQRLESAKKRAAVAAEKMNLCNDSDIGATPPATGFNFDFTTPPGGI